MRLLIATAAGAAAWYGEHRTGVVANVMNGNAITRDPTSTSRLVAAVAAFSLVYLVR